MSNENEWITFWHQPTDTPILGTVEQVEEYLNSIEIPYKIGKSEMKNHLAFSVEKNNLSKAVKGVERKFGRNI